MMMMRRSEGEGGGGGKGLPPGSRAERTWRTNEATQGLHFIRPQTQMTANPPSDDLVNNKNTGFIQWISFPPLNVYSCSVKSSSHTSLYDGDEM